MTRDDAVRAAIIELFEALKLTQDKPISVYEVGIPLVPKGFLQSELVDALWSLKKDGTIDLISGNRLQLKKPITDPETL